MSSSIWNEEMINEIRARAETGAPKVRGFGANRLLPTLDALTIVPSQLAGKMPIDFPRENISTEVVIGEGREDVSKPVKIKTPIYISGMSFGALSKSAKMALAMGAGIAGSMTNTGEGGTFEEEKEIVKQWGAKFVVQWSTARFGVSASYLNSGDAIEIRIGKGAAPGLGGYAPAEKISAEIARLRGIPYGLPAVSPNRHLDIEETNDLRRHILLMREVVDYKLPIFVKIGAGRVYEDVRAAIAAGADAIVLDSSQGGTGSTVEVVSEHAGVPLLGMFAPAMRAFKETNAKENGVRLLVSGGIRNGADVYKALALGADAVGLGTAVLISAGCYVCQECHLGKCTIGLATQDPKLESKLDWKTAGERIGRFISSITEELKLLCALSGHASVRELTNEDLRALTYDAAAITGIKLIGYDQQLPMWTY
ncbi:MAG: FMN-binding glutamate synthase family protein [Thermoplasmata archaeon]